MDDIESEEIKYRWTTDQYLINYIFSHLNLSSEHFSQANYQMAFDALQIGWNVIETMIIDKINDSQDQKVIDEYTKYIDLMIDYINSGNQFLIPSNTPNPHQRQQEESKRNYELRVLIVEMNKHLFRAMNVCGLWMTKQTFLPPSQAIKRKFIQ